MKLSTNIKIHLDTKRLDEIAANIGRETEDVVRILAFDLEAHAKKNITQMKAVDTGAMLNSVYTVTAREDGYNEAMIKAKTQTFSQKRQANVEPATTHPHPKPDGKKIFARVGPCVDYAAYVEYGTSRMAARPFMLRACEKIWKEFRSKKRWEKLYKRGAR